MKFINLTLLSLILATSCIAQQREQRRFGAPSMWGPVRSARLEKVEMIKQGGELIEGPRVLLQTVSYNEDSTRRELTTYNANGSVSARIVEIYDPDGRILETSSFNPRGEPGNRIEYKYEDLKRQIGRTTRRPDGSVAGKLTFTYEGDKRIEEVVNYDKDGAVISKVTGTLNLTTHQIEAVTQTPNQTVQRQAGFTDIPNGQIYEEKVNGVAVQRTLTSSAGGRGPEITQFNSDGTVQSKYRRQTEFDSHHNGIRWVSLQELPGGKFQPVTVFYRTIEYYEDKVQTP